MCKQKSELKSPRLYGEEPRAKPNVAPKEVLLPKASKRVTSFEGAINLTDQPFDLQTSRGSVMHGPVLDWLKKQKSSSQYRLHVMEPFKNLNAFFSCLHSVNSTRSDVS